MQSYAGTLNFNELSATESMPQTALAELIEEVREFECAWGDAYMNRDLAALAQIMADDYTFTDPLGSVTDKAQNLAYISTGEFVIQDTHSRNIYIRIYGDTAVVTALSNFKARYRGVGVGGSYQYTDVLVRRQGRWTAVASQATLAGRGLLFLLGSRFVGDRLNAVALLPGKLRNFLSHCST